MIAKIDRYILGKTLGVGFSAKVKMATDPEGNNFAIKIINVDKIDQKQAFMDQLKQEIVIIQQLKHQNFVKYFDFKESATWFKKSGKTEQVAYIVQELVEGGELFSYIAEEGQFSANLCRYYFK